MESFSIYGSNNLSSESVSKKIRKIELKMHEKDNIYINLYNKLRIDIDFINLMNLNLKSDTIFILQTYNFIEGFNELSIAIVNRNEEFFYIVRDTLPIYKKPFYRILDYKRMCLYKVKKECGYSLYPKYMIQLVSKWDIDGLRKEGETNWMIGGGTITAIRIILKNGKYNIDCISFKEFYNLKRDMVH
ncbi:MAG: hypothetical protein FWF53_09540 [Candidatus Azobacteroides sp.]|nr:hypothetical protein [Candidatus Azobacteroides sp.]